MDSIVTLKTFDMLLKNYKQGVANNLLKKYGGLLDNQNGIWKSAEHRHRTAVKQIDQAGLFYTTIALTMGNIQFQPLWCLSPFFYLEGDSTVVYVYVLKMSWFCMLLYRMTSDK